MKIIGQAEATDWAYDKILQPYLPGQKYLVGNYLEFKTSSSTIRIYKLVTKEVYFYKKSIVYPFINVVNGNSCIVCLKRMPQFDSVPDTEHLWTDVDIATEHINLPKPLSHYANSSNYEEFIKNITITP